MLRPLPLVLLSAVGSGRAVQGKMPEKSYIGIIRVPKSGSVSLTLTVQQAFAGRRIFDLPSSLVADMGDTPMQRFRAMRSQTWHLIHHYRTPSLARAIRVIEEQGRDGDVIGGGHIDHATFCRFPTPVRYVVLFREPVARFVSEYNYSRNGYLRKKPWLRFDASVMAKLAGTNSLEGYAEALAAGGPMFANIAARYMGIGSREQIAPRFQECVFQAGVIEDLEPFREGLSAKTRIAFPAVHAHRTGVMTEMAVSAAARRKLEHLFALDFELYEHARTIARSG